MNLPNYFLADLPPEAALTPTLISEACRTVRRNRERFLASRTTDQVVHILAALGRDWLSPDNRFRRLALEHGPARTGFGRATIERGLDAFFGELTAENLRALVVQDLGDERALDGFCAVAGQRRAALARGPQLLVHIAAGNLPNPALLSLVLGLLTRSAQFLKCAFGAAFFPRLFAHSLYETDPKLAACLEVAEWRGGHAALENALFACADCVTATGSDPALTAVRATLPPHVRFLGYGHRVSFGFVARGALGAEAAREVAVRAATDVAAWDQAGCLSPHLFYVQQGGPTAAKSFAELLAAELERVQGVQPRGPLPPELAADIAARRAVYEVRAAHAPGTQMWHSEGSTAWTVVYEEEARFQLSCLNRFVYVKPVADLTEALRAAEPVREKVSTVGLAASDGESDALVTQLARWGVARVCPIGRMQQPPLTWRHDGRPALGDLVTWTDWEQE